MEYKKITPDRYEEVIQHLRDSFFCDEPLNSAAKLCERGEGNEDLEHHSLTTLDDGFSVMALDEDNHIAGVILNGVMQRGDIERAQEKLDICLDENFKKIFNLLYDENLAVNFFDRFDVEKVFDIRILSVDPHYRGMGIAKRLMRESEKIAIENGFKIMKADATGICSQKVCAQNGFEKISEVIYSEYVDNDRVPILNVEPPHDKLMIMFKMLS
uniref:aralkylamine N-acetyltransferase n=1 Tax=Tabanus bromius TaxID=304241 RepID=A0A0K8TQB9_TABBR